jgi:hypothetical protein
LVSIRSILKWRWNGKWSLGLRKIVKLNKNRNMIYLNAGLYSQKVTDKLQKAVGERLTPRNVNCFWSCLCGIL